MQAGTHFRSFNPPYNTCKEELGSLAANLEDRHHALLTRVRALSGDESCLVSQLERGSHS